MSNQIVVRFAPSPTGFLHIGGVRTALFNYLFAKHNGGKFVLRIDDTDKARNRDEWTEDLIKDLAWLGLNHDAFAKQSERIETYKKYTQKLIDDGHAYISKEEVKEEGQRPEVIRFKNPNKKIKFTDIIRGEVEIDTTELGDFVIARSVDEPVYHLATVIDDFEMKITHIIRAEEHLYNTPRQLLIQEAIGAPKPFYAHIPLVLAADKSKLSKRKHGEAVSLSHYRNLGYLPEAIINFVALIGWNPGTDKEVFSMQELIESFDLARVQKAGAVFNVEKLDWLNKEYIKKMDTEKLAVELKKYIPEDWQEKTSGNPEMWQKIVEVEKERISKFSDIGQGIGFFFDTPGYSKELLSWKGADLSESKKHLTKILEALESLDHSDFSLSNIKNAVWPYAEENGKGNVLWPFRAALTGLERSPEPFTVASILGQPESVKRLKAAIDLI